MKFLVKIIKIIIYKFYSTIIILSILFTKEKTAYYNRYGFGDFVCFCLFLKNANIRNKILCFSKVIMHLILNL